MTCLSALLATGCGSFKLDAKFDAAIKKIFRPRRTPQQQMLIAVSSSDADLRRDALVRVAESKQHDASWAVKGMTAIATLETDPHTRCVAIRGLARSGDAGVCATMLKILNHEQHPPQEIRPPDRLTSWEATAALADLSAGGGVPDDHAEAVRTTLIQRLRADSERHTRIAAARGLGYYPADETVKALIEGLRDADFATVRGCEDSLIRLTGHSGNCIPYEWEVWYKQNSDDLFANAGVVPESRRLPYDNKWEKAVYKTKRFFAGLFPAKKQQ